MKKPGGVAARHREAARRPAAVFALLAALTLIAAGALLSGCGTTPAVRWEGPDPAGRRYFAAFRELWLEDELAAHPQLAEAPRYRLHLEVADDLRRVDGSLALLYTNRLERPLAELPFFCYPNVAGGALKVGSVQVGGTPVQPQWRAEGTLLAVPLPSPLRPGGRVEIRIRFLLEVPEGRGGEPGLFALTGDGLLSLGHAYPMVPAPSAWSDRRPAPYGDFVTNEVAFFTARIGLPEGVQLAAPGVELGRRAQRAQSARGMQGAQPGRGAQRGRTEVLLALGPARELYLAAGRDLVLLEERRGPLVVRSAAARAQEGDARVMLEAAHAALEIFGRRFGPYPFTTFSVISAPLRALGMEFPGVVLLASRLYGNAKAVPPEVPEDPQRLFELEGTLAHEVAHQWFYAMVGSDQLEEPWIDESLAQYAFWLYYRDRYGDGAVAWREIEDTWDRIGRAEIPIGRPVSAYTHDEYGGVIYGRAPLFLEALSELMGEERFDAFLRQLALRYRWRMIDGEGFRSLVLEVGGCDPQELDRLWAKWVEGTRQARPFDSQAAEPVASTE
jgi:hypothetical protein